MTRTPSSKQPVFLELLDQLLDFAYSDEGEANPETQLIAAEEDGAIEVITTTSLVDGQHRTTIHFHHYKD